MLTQLKEENGIWKSAAYYSSNVWNLEWEHKPTTGEIVAKVKESAQSKEHQEYLERITNGLT